MPHTKTQARHLQPRLGSPNQKKDLGWAAGGGLFGGGGGAAGGFGGYENTAIGQIIVLAYLNAYTDMVTQLGGLPLDAAAAAPEAR